MLCSLRVWHNSGVSVQSQTIYKHFSMCAPVNRSSAVRKYHRKNSCDTLKAYNTTQADYLSWMYTYSYQEGCNLTFWVWCAWSRWYESKKNLLETLYSKQPKVWAVVPLVLLLHIFSSVFETWQCSIWASNIINLCIYRYERKKKGKASYYVTLHIRLFKDTWLAMTRWTPVSYQTTICSRPCFQRITEAMQDVWECVSVWVYKCVLLMPSKAFGCCCEASPLAHRDRNWFPLQLWLPHLKRGSDGPFSIRTERGGGEWQDGKGKRKWDECCHLWKWKGIPDIVLAMNIERAWTGKLLSVLLNTYSQCNAFCSKNKCRFCFKTKFQRQEKKNK